MPAMSTPRRTWQDELAIIDRTMKAISGVTDPEELVGVYWEGIGDLLPNGDYLALSRRNMQAPEYLITRSSRFLEPLNPWTQRDRLPRFAGGLLGEIAYGNKPVILDDLPDHLAPDEPASYYLEGFQTMVALPQYDAGEALNVTIMLFPPTTASRTRSSR
jgi:sigma-B regulation protein RsbU (phosphoserine phosphatase)